jgi:hypothetical protein
VISRHSGTYVAIIVSISIAMFVILLIFAVVLYRRKKLYGKFYIFTNPPLLDYIERIDEKKLLVEQTNKLPYLSEWEFPRERVFIGNHFILVYRTTQALKTYVKCVLLRVLIV